jgi:hypothetical protein
LLIMAFPLGPAFPTQKTDEWIVDWTLQSRAE